MYVRTKEDAIKYLTPRCFPGAAEKILDKQGLTALRSGFRPTGSGCKRCGKEVSVYWRESLYVYRQHAIVLDFEQPVCAHCGTPMALDAKCVSPHQKEIDAFCAEVDKKLDGVAREVGPHENRCGDVRSILREGDDGMDEPNEMPEAKVCGAKHIFDLLYGVIAEQMDPIEAMRTAGRLVEGVSSIIHSICDVNHVRYERDFASNSTLERDELLRWQRWAAAQLGDDSPRTNQELRERLTTDFRRRSSTKVRELQKEVDTRIRDMDTMRQDLARTHATLCRWRTWAGELLKLDDVGLWDEELRGRIVGLIEVGATPRVDEHKRTVDRLREDLAQTNSHLATWQRWACSVLREGPLALSDDELRGRIQTALWDRGYVSDSERAKQIDELAKQIVRWREWASDTIRDELILFADDDGWRRELNARIAQNTNAFDLERFRDELIEWRTWAASRLNAPGIVPEVATLNDNQELRMLLGAHIRELDKLRSVVDGIREAIKVAE